MKYKKWKNEEIEFLKSNYNFTNKKLSEITGHPISSVTDKLRKLNITKDINNIPSGRDNPNWKGGMNIYICSFCGSKVKRYKLEADRYKLCFCNRKCKGRYMSRNIIGENHPKFSGRRIGSDGHISIYSKDHPNRDSENMVREHRLVMEKHIGRFLDSKEVVHHIDGDVSNNNINNLMLFKNNSEHIKYHIKLSKNMSQNGVFNKIKN